VATVNGALPNLCGTRPETELRFCIGIEGVQTRSSVAVLSRLDGTILATSRQRAELQLHTLDPAVLAARVQQLLTNLLQCAKARHPDEFRDIAHTGQLLQASRTCFGISGVTFSVDRILVLPRILRNAGWPEGAPVVCTGDAEISFVSHTGTLNGSMILAASGSTGYAVASLNGQPAMHWRQGGWGPAVGDEGSAFRIGSDAIRAIGREFDARVPASELWKAMLAWLRDPAPRTTATAKAAARWELYEAEVKVCQPALDLRTLLFRFVHEASYSVSPGEWRQVASRLVIPVVAAAEQGDETAEGLLEAALDELDAQQEGACFRAEKAGYRAVQPIVLSGGLLTKNPRLLEGLTQRITRRLMPREGDIRVITSSEPGTMRPVLGALLLALGGSEPERLRLPDEKTIDAVRAQHARSDLAGDLAHE
jgi:N-acetylglucosamine kinase-like BadF-type ATPase